MEAKSKGNCCSGKIRLTPLRSGKEVAHAGRLSGGRGPAVSAGGLMLAWLPDFRR